MKSMLAAVLVVVVAGAWGSDDIYFGPNSYDTLADMARIMRMQRLSELENGDDFLLGDDLVSRSGPSEEDWGADGYGDDVFSAPLYSGTHARDQEHLEQSSLHGYLSMSGGSSDTDKPSDKPTKTDKQLPAYCNPPNPCPLGKTAKDGCEEHFENSAANNKRLLEQQDCPCDTEHMASCPAGSKTVSSQPRSDVALSSVMDQLQQLGVDLPENTAYMPIGDKRGRVVAKKSPGMIRKRSVEDFAFEFNPYLLGEKMKRASKKSPPMK